MNIFENKKIILLGVLGVFLLIFLILIIRPFFNTQLIVKTTPPVQEVLIDNSPILPNAAIKQERGKHTLTIKEYGYKKYTEEIVVKNYGLTEIVVTLTKKTKDLLKDVPLEDPLLPYSIKGNYNNDNEPEYLITVYVSFEVSPEERKKIKEEAKKWLTERGVTEKNSIIKYFEDGE